jgi:hypothetical protein
METQNATTHLSPPNVDHATVRSSTPSRTGEKKKIAKVTCRTPNQPPKTQKSTLKMDEDAGDTHDPTKKKKKKKNLETPGPDKRKLWSTSDRESLTTQTRNC